MQRAICRGIFAPAQPDFLAASVRDFLSGAYKGLINAAIVRRKLQEKDVPDSFYEIQNRLGTKPYCAMQPIVANIRDIDPNKPSVRAERALTERGQTVGFKIYMPRSYRWWVIDGQHRRYGGEMLLEWLRDVIRSGKYPVRNAIVDLKGDASSEELAVWREADECARSFATVKVELHLGLDIDQERQLFHDLNNLGKRINVSLAVEFDQGNPINHFTRETLERKLNVQTSEKEVKDWDKDDGMLLKKDLSAINAIAFLNKTNVKSATPEVVNARSHQIERLWGSIIQIDHFGKPGARKQTVSAQPVVLKALAKLTFDLLFSNRKPANGDALFEKLLSHMGEVDFSHDNKMWRYYQLTEEDRSSPELAGLSTYLPSNGAVTAESNRDVGAYQGGVMRFGAKHNDIYPILADMIRWRLKLPNRHQENAI